MKLTLHEMTVHSYKSGPHEGELRPFILLEGAQIVHVHHGYMGDYPYVRITYTLPEEK